MLDQLLALLAKNQIQAPVEWNTDKPTRYESQWFVGKKWDYNGKEYYKAWFGDYKKDFEGKWNSYDEQIMSKDEIAAAKKQADDLLAKEKEEREKEFETSAVNCATEFETFNVSGTTPYLERKIIKGLYGARLKDNPGHDPILCVPLRDVDGKLWNYQRIYSQKLSKGDKFFADAARIDGLFHVLDWSPTKAPSAGDQIFICEGFATAATVYEALRHTDAVGPTAFVVAAFNAGNLQAVATELKARYPDNPIVVCADNDAYTVINNKPYNVGIEKARRAAGAVGGKIVYPVFKYPKKGLTDFNDLVAAEGLDKVRDQIENFENYVKGIQPMCLPANKSGKLKEPTEKEVSEYILDFFSGRITRQDKSLFVYNGTHWYELDAMGTDRLKQMIGVASNGLLGSRDLEAYYRYLLVHAPQVPGGVNLFQPNPFVANFQNGTLHLGKQIEFKKHDASDYLTSTLPFDMPQWIPGTPLPPSPIFDDMIERIWANNVDKKEVHELAEELIGSCLAPAYPNITIFFGPPKSGKSTFIKLLVKLVQRDNVCSVQLCDFTGFNMETMVGKLVNFDTDIDVNRPMNDSAVKKLIDRVPMKVRRKGRADIYAHLPAVHLFAANALPKSLDGSSHAYGRRMILVETSSLAIQGKGTFDFEHQILEQEMPGLIARGLKGLYRLHANGGHYTVPESSSIHIEAMEIESDVIGQFLDDISGKEVHTDKGHILIRGPGVKIERSSLWEVFRNWQLNSFPRGGDIGKIKFFAMLATRGIAARKSDGVFYVNGLGIQAGKESIG